METLAMILPSCLRYEARIENQILLAGLQITESARVSLSLQQAKELTDQDKLAKVLSSEPVKAYCLKGEDAVNVWRRLIGPEDPTSSEAEWWQLRCKFANGLVYSKENPDNGFYGSVSASDAKRQLSLMRKWGYMK